MVQNIQYHSKREKVCIVRKYWYKARWKIIWANCKLCIVMSDVKVLIRSPISFSFIDYNMLLSLGLFYSLLAAVLSMCPRILASLTSWGFHDNLGFTFTASHIDPLGLPGRDTSDTCLASVASLTHGERFYNLLYS